MCLSSIDDGPYVVCEECGGLLLAADYDRYDSHGQPLPIICDECMELARDDEE